MSDVSKGRFELSGTRVWVAGHSGMVGSALVRRLQREALDAIVTAPSAELDLRRQEDVRRFVRRERPDVLLLAAARVGGIQENRARQGEFLYDNLMIAANCIEAARLHDVERTLVLGSSCAYPRDSPQPITEERLLTGPLEPTNQGYAIAKIAGLELAKMYRRQYGLDAVTLMPTNLYGPHDDFGVMTAHVLPALLHKIHMAKRRGDKVVELWGTGRPRREFLHVDDLADAAVFALVHYRDEQHLNVGAGQELSIDTLASLTAEVVGWDGRFVYDTSMPDGMPRKLLDSSRIRSLGWEPKIDLRQGLIDTYRWFLENHGASRERR